MKNKLMITFAALLCLAGPLAAQEVSLDTAPAVVVKTVPAAGSNGIDPKTTEIQITFSKKMQDGSWSWAQWTQNSFPELNGKPKYLADGKTCVLPVKLQPGKTYALWANTEKFRNFKDTSGKPSIPYLLIFETKK
jgi:RNA polymerase sigma-70 factor (ECF subfamily)